MLKAKYKFQTTFLRRGSIILFLQLILLSTNSIKMNSFGLITNFCLVLFLVSSQIIFIFDF